MKKDVIVFVNAIRPATFDALAIFAKQTKRSFRPVVLVDNTIHESIFERNKQHDHLHKVIVISADFSDPTSVRRALTPYIDDVFAVTCQYENSILELKRIIPYLPYTSMPSEKSLDWATEKKLMRQMLEAYDKTLVPRYIEVSDTSTKTISLVEKKMKYPLIVKPSGLEGSLLVSRAESKAELKRALKHIFEEIQKGYDTWIKRQQPAVLVEEFMEGEMYSIDSYVADDGTCQHTPAVKVVTGHKVGFNDFFGYMRLVPSGLSEKDVLLAQNTAEHACRALGLRSITAHVELMKTRHGWKVIELGPRIGGYRHTMYQLAYGINHIMNDILNRAGEAPDIRSTCQNHTAVFNFYAPEEGLLKDIKGVELIGTLPSLISLNQVVEIGGSAQFAKNNGDPILEVTLSHSDVEQFNKDIALLEQTIGFEVEPHSEIYV